MSCGFAKNSIYSITRLQTPCIKSQKAGEINTFGDRNTTEKILSWCVPLYSVNRWLDLDACSDSGLILLVLCVNFCQNIIMPGYCSWWCPQILTIITYMYYFTRDYQIVIPKYIILSWCGTGIIFKRLIHSPLPPSKSGYHRVNFT